MLLNSVFGESLNNKGLRISKAEGTASKRMGNKLQLQSDALEFETGRITYIGDFVHEAAHIYLEQNPELRTNDPGYISYAEEKRINYYLTIQLHH